MQIPRKKDEGADSEPPADKQDEILDQKKEKMSVEIRDIFYVYPDELGRFYRAYELWTRQWE